MNESIIKESSFHQIHPSVTPFSFHPLDWSLLQFSCLLPLAWLLPSRVSSSLPKAGSQLTGDIGEAPKWTSILRRTKPQSKSP